MLPHSALPCIDFEDAMHRASANRQTLLFSLLSRHLSWITPEEEYQTQGAVAENFSGRPGVLAEALDTYRRNNTRVVIVSVQAPRVRGLLRRG